MDLDKIGSVMGVTKMVSSKPEKSKNSGWGMVIMGIVLIVVGLALVLAPESMIKIDGDRIVLFVPLIFGVVLTVAGVASVVINKNNLSKALNALHNIFFQSEARVLNLYLVGAGLIGLRAGQSIEWPTQDGRLRRLTVTEVSAG